MIKSPNLITKALLTILIASACLIIQAKVYTINPIAKSLLVPGWGQASQGHNYGYAMLTSEALIWSAYFYNSNEKSLKDRESYEYALKFAHIAPGHYSSDYYRTISKYSSSGFNAGGYNAMIRQSAIGEYPQDPIAQQAYIDQNKMPDNRSWEWDASNNRKNYSNMRKNILEIKDRAQIMTGLIIANHLISGIDMFRKSRVINTINPSIQYYNDTPILHFNIEF